MQIDGRDRSKSINCYQLTARTRYYCRSRLGYYTRYCTRRRQRTCERYTAWGANYNYIIIIIIDRLTPACIYRGSRIYFLK